MNQNYLKVLKETELFKNVNENVYKKLIKTENMVKYTKGENIYFKGNVAEMQNKIGIILKGDVAIKNNSSPEDISSNQSLVLNKLTKNDVLGFSMAFSKDEDKSFKMSAMTNSLVLFINNDELKSLFKEDENILDNYLRISASNINYLGKKIKGFTASSAEEKLAVYLLDHMVENKKEDDSIEYTVPIPSSMSKLAVNLNLGRASLYRAWDTLEDNYVILRDKRDVKIINLEKLKKIC